MSDAEMTLAAARAPPRVSSSLVTSCHDSLQNQLTAFSHNRTEVSQYLPVASPTIDPLLCSHCNCIAPLVNYSTITGSKSWRGNNWLSIGIVSRLNLEHSHFHWAVRFTYWEDSYIHTQLPRTNRSSPLELREKHQFATAK